MDDTIIKRCRSSHCCSVIGCTNRYNTRPEIKFYRFPKNAYEVEKLENWIKAVRSINPDKSWRPGKHSLICSAHFIGNKKSNVEKDPSYNPTIFPAIRKTKNIQGTLLNENSVPNDSSTLQHHSQIGGKTDVSCQVSMESEAEEFYFECGFYTNATCTQISTPRTNTNFVFKKTVKSKSCNTSTKDIASCQNGFHGYSSVANLSDTKFTSITGVSQNVFSLLHKVLLSDNGYNTGLKSTVLNDLLIFLLQMKSGLTYTALGVLFNLDRRSIAEIFKAVLHVLFKKTKNFVFWASKEQISATMPDSFKRSYKDCRVIVDCTEMKVEVPKEIDERVFLYSNYKSCHTSKFLIGITPGGFISFISECYGGRSSDSFIMNDCKIMDLIEHGDIVLADKGFPGVKSQKDAIIVMPPFVHNGELTSEEIKKTYKIASVRIHVERMIQRVKTFAILQFIPKPLFPLIDEIVFMAAVLSNLQNPIIKE